MIRKINGKVVAVLAVAVALASTASAQAVDYGSTISTNMGVIETLWGKVATIMIAVALVTVGVKFFKKSR